MSQKIAYFIVGDIHGMHQQLGELLKTSFGKRYRNTERCILVFLGDYIDRGPQSAQVVKTIRELQAGVGKGNGWLDVIALRGNHEQMMIDACTRDDPQDHFFWTRNGGRETMNSYGVQNTWDVPKEDVEWMLGLPTRHINHDHKAIFVHAGFYPNNYPDFSDDVAMWTRSGEFLGSGWPEDDKKNGWTNPMLEGYTVFHGHTPEHYKNGQEPYHDTRRVNLDTGACFGGSLSMAIFRPYMDEARNRLQFHQVRCGIVTP